MTWFSLSRRGGEGGCEGWACAKVRNICIMLELEVQLRFFKKPTCDIAELLFVWRYSARALFCVVKCLDLCVLCRETEPAENHLKDMLQQLNTLIAAKPSEKASVCQGECTLLAVVDSFSVCIFHHLCACQHCAQRVFFSVFVFLEEAEDPACVPIFWISKWVDYSDKYGLGKSWSDPTTNSKAWWSTYSWETFWMSVKLQTNVLPSTQEFVGATVLVLLSGCIWCCSWNQANFWLFTADILTRKSRKTPKV